ncbi:hypothetical protein [Chitinophaga agri]|uniref:Uncharacterized protein n=1 Tax=Chitinophaga agri TaxID=2703787 RepID=A0A6B9ZP76_9BACT|nr:hypothetical protein [Chitinophaga agri]QHS63736.1 hypothetical protein GWR21_30395 [Chitinophaga agri]
MGQNAAGVSFYEHLGDDDDTLVTMHKWVKKSIYLQIRELLTVRLDTDKMKQLDRSYGMG